MNFRPRIFAALIALFAFVPMSFFSSSANTQQYPSNVQAPRIDGFDVEPAQQLLPGNELVFTLYGSPGGTARVRIIGSQSGLLLDEVEGGVYEGTYTIKSRDKITATSTATANLRLGNRIASALLDEPLVATAAPAVKPPVASTLPKIDRFAVFPANRLAADEDMIFSLTGTPGGEASVRVVGVIGKIDLYEIKPGVYEGTYVIKNRDRIAADATTTATLRVADQNTSAVLGQSLLARAGSPPRPRGVAWSCANCGVVEAINVVQVEGNGSYVGMIAGGVLGALIGSQVGSGRGTTAAEIAGAVGGAVAGREVEKRIKKTQHYDVVVRLENGGTQTVSYPTQPAFRVGDKVKVENGVLVASS